MAELDSWQFLLGKTRISVTHVFEVVFTSGMVLVLALWLSATLEQRVLSRAFDDLSMRKVAANAMRVFLLLIGTLFALSSLGFDLTTLSVIGGALGVGIGFGLQKLAANYVSGFVILIERSLRIGDFVRVDGFEGRVTDIKTRYPWVRAGNGSESVVPNELLLTQRVENLSLTDSKISQSTVITVAYDAPVDTVMPLLRQACESQARVLTEPAPSVALSAFGPDGLEFTVNYWFEDPEGGQLNLKSDINLAILKSLQENGIQIPFPQRVVHLNQKP
jgi:small-conductance mechanosensitive channel